MSEAEASTSIGRAWQAIDARVDAAGLGALVLRLIVGWIFLLNGTHVLGWFGGRGGIEGKEAFVRLLGYDPVSPIAWLLTITEIAAGVLLILGFLTPLAAAGAIGISLNLILNLGWKQGFLGPEGGYALSVVLSVAALALALTGPGRYSMDGALRSSLRGNRWGAATVALGAGVGILVLTAFGPGFGGFAPPAEAPIQAGACPPPVLESSFLPDGFNPTQRPGFIPSQWLKSWEKSSDWFQVLGGITADRGGGSTAPVKVRGTDGSVGTVAEEDGVVVLAVDWTERTDCGTARYAVIGKGISQADLVKIAQLLK